MKDVTLDGMVYQMCKEVIQRSRIDPQMIEDVCLGNVCLAPSYNPVIASTTLTLPS